MAKAKDRFEMTPKGYRKAVEYLKSVGKWEQVSTTGFSTDGFSIVHEANSIYKKEQQKRKDDANS